MNSQNQTYPWDPYPPVEWTVFTLSR